MNPTKITNEWDIKGEVNFLEAIAALRFGTCDAIYGSSGGILILNKLGGVVYQSNPKRGIDFSADAYLSPWRLLKKKNIESSLLSRLSSSTFEDKYAVVGSHPELGSGILTWNKTMEEAWNNSTIINDSGGEARAVTKEEALSMNILRPPQESDMVTETIGRDMLPDPVDQELFETLVKK